MTAPKKPPAPEQPGATEDWTFAHLRQFERMRAALGPDAEITRADVDRALRERKAVGAKNIADIGMQKNNSRLN
jgi:hypothetical protein